MSNSDQLIQLVESSELTYVPTAQQRILKSAFLTRIAESPLEDMKSISLPQIQKYVYDNRLPKWWSQPGFREWFTNREEFRERVESLAHLALDTLQKILLDEDSKSMSARVNAAKILMEVGKKMPPKGGIREVYADDKVGKMGRAELEEFLKRNQPKLLEEPKVSEEAS
jgi:hypothetical protein